MPKDLQPNKPCRADTKKSTNANAGGGGGGKSVTSSNAKASKVIASKAAKKKPDTKKKPPKVVAGSDGGGEKVKGRKKAEPIKTRSGVRLVDSNAGNRTTAANKMKDKQKTAAGADKGKGKDEKGKVIKKEPGVAKKSATSVSCAGGVGSNVGVVKKEVKKVKCDNNDDTARKPTKSVKKDDADRKEITVKTEENDDVENVKKDAKRGRETPSQGVKKTTSKVKKDEGDKKDTCKMVDKTDDKKEAIKKEEEPTKKEPAKKDLKTKDDAVKTANDKESKSKSTKASKKRPKSDDKCVYDNIDEGSDDASKKVKKKDTSTTKTKLAKIGEETEIKIRKHLEEFKKSKPKQRKPAASKSDDKRKLDSDSDVESKKCRKKLKKNVEDEDDEIEEPSPPVKAKTPVKKSAAKAPAKEEEHSSQSSDDVPLNKLKNSKCKTVDRKPSPKKPAKGKKEEKPSTSPVATKCAPKKVRFEKEATKSPPTAPPAKAVRRRKPRMASLNAMAMVHCLYENEYKSVSVSSHDSTDNSDDNATESASEPVAVKRKSESGATSSPSKSAANAKETALVKYEKDATSVDEPDPVICRESLRSAPGLRSVGKHWDMNSSSISSTLSDENIEIIAPPVVIKEIVAVDKPMTVKNALKKKFARALRRQISEESSEEEKHQALLLEEKKRMVRRRRRQRKEITMDLKDMVVCKRMASLNATAILAASYSSTTGKRTITVKSTGKGEEKRENVENFEKTESVIAKIKNRKLPFIRKKFSSSSDADVEDEADLSGNEVVLKTASSSGKQQVSLIVNQDSGVTITGVYLNSTTKSTHHQGYCSISGMQYRISSTSHTQTEATAVASEAIVRTPQEPLRPPITVSLHPDRQSPPPPHNVALAAGHPSPVKTYTPLGALSNMQPPGSPHHVHHLHHHPKTVTISATQEISSLERHGCPSAFSAPTVYGPAPPPPLPSVPARPPYPILSKTPPEAGFVTGYYQPAGPLISHHHHHHHHHHHVQANTTTTTSTAAALPASSATPASSSAPAMSYSTKVSQSPLVQPPTPPASNVTHPVSENSDNEMTSATTPAAEIAQSTDTAPEETNFPPTYRFGPPPSANPPFHSPSRNYQSYYPSPPSTASLSHPQQQAHFQEILYSGNPAAGPPAPYHLSYLQPKAAPYHGSFQRRYIPALPPQQYFHHEYSSSVPASNAVQQQVVVPAHPLTSTADSYHSAPPTPSVVESYPPPPPLYYSGYNSAPPTPYYPYATSSRSLTLVETSCPCPLQGCQKNVHTGPLTGIISKGPVKQHSTPLSPVALSLPKEPQDIRSLPSPARGSAGCRPTPSPAIATAKNPSSCWSEGTDGSSYDTTGLLAISKHDERRSPAPTKNGCKSSRSELKKLKIKKIKSRSKSVKQHQVCKSDENMAEFRLNGAGRQFYADARENSDTVGLMAAQAVTDYVTRVKPTIVDVCETEVYDENTLDTSDEPKTKKYHQCRKRRMDDEADKDMLKSYPVMRENVQKGIHASPDDQTPKKPKLEVEPHVNPTDDDKPVDVEKNNYLSALQLCSVTEVEAAPEQDELAKDSCATAENLAPMRKREDDKNLKIAAKPQEEVERCSERTADTIVEQPQPDDVDRASASAPPCQTQVESKKPPRLRRKRWTNKKRNKKKTNKATKGSEEEKIEAENAEKIRRAELLSLTQKRSESKLKWSNGWSWLGEPFVSKVFLNTEGSEVLRTCYHAMKHQAGDIIKPKDCILLRSGSKKSDLPYVAKVAHLWEDPEDGEMMMSLFWFYRPEHTEHDSMHSKSPYELYHKSLRQSEESVDVSSVIVPPLSKKRYPRHSLLPPENTSLDLVFFCRKIYDFRQHRLLKNPFFV